MSIDTTAIAAAVQSFSADDNTVSVLVMLVGIIIGWKLTSVHQQMKAKRVKLDRSRTEQLRRPE